MIAAWRGYLQRIRVDNGPELISWKMFDWAARHDVELAFIQPGKPAQSAYIERFNSTFLEDVWMHFFSVPSRKRAKSTELWIEEYNAIRPHDYLDGLPPY